MVSSILKKKLLAILPKEAFAESFPVCIGSCGCTFDRFRFFCSTLFLDLQVLCKSSLIHPSHSTYVQFCTQMLSAQ